MKVKVTVMVDRTGWLPHALDVDDVANDVLTGANEYAGPTELVEAVEVEG